ncbi:Transcription factor Adf-1 [Operophtera brumata]|uniref:Transcription factor Adf-1 n=1 Tax=Operophtera brumata TaxID=104452 RepID=A0A0L7LIM6_OPEBR|nr:Transcription factor Adf-1 [Operophtera brumata]
MFSAKVDQRLISLVKANPVLYDFNDRKYMDFNTREVAWQKIGDELEKPAADCKVRWINIRDVHRRILRKSMSGHGRPARAYKYDKQLEFMKNFYKEVVTANAMSDEEDDNDNDDGDKNSEAWNDVIIECKNDSEVEDEKPLKKAKKIKRSLKSCAVFEEVDVSTASTIHETSAYEREKDYDVSDPVDAFLLSIGATLKQFSPYHLNLAKSKIFHIVQEHDLQQIVEKRQGRLDCDISTSSEPIYYQG